MDRTEQINTFSRLSQVSRETITSLIKYEDLLIKANKSLNLIGKSTVNQIWIRHFLDSFQVIDFVRKNQNTLVDLGSGAGFPGLVLAIAAKERKMSLKIKLFEKSPKKSKFLKGVISELNLNTQVTCKNVLDDEVKLTEQVFTARAFKPLKVICELIHSKAKNFEKFFIFMGKTGPEELLQTSKNWDIKYKQRMSVTSNDSSIIEVYKIRIK